METKIKNLVLKPCYVLVEPQPDSTSTFSSEHKKYDRKSIGTIVLSFADEDHPKYSEGVKIVFDDANSISLSAGGKAYELLHQDDILGFFKEDK